MRQKHVGESLGHLLREKGIELVGQWKKLLAHKDMQAVCRHPHIPSSSVTF